MVVGHHDAVGGRVLVVPLGEGCASKEVCPILMRTSGSVGETTMASASLALVEEPVGLRVEESVTGDDVLPVADGIGRRLA